MYIETRIYVNGMSLELTHAIRAPWNQPGEARVQQFVASGFHKQLTSLNAFHCFI